MMFEIAIFNGREILFLAIEPCGHYILNTCKSCSLAIHSLSRRPNGMAPTGGGLRFIRKPSAAPEMLCQLHRSRASHTASHPYGTVSQEAVAAAA